MGRFVHSRSEFAFSWTSWYTPARLSILKSRFFFFVSPVLKRLYFLRSCVKIDAVEVKQIVIINSFLFRNKRGSALCYRKTVLCCCCIVSRALPFARISQRFWRPWSERSHEWIAVGTQEWYRFHNRKTKVTKLCFRRWRCSNLTHTHTHTHITRVRRTLYCVIHIQWYLG